MDEVKGQGHIVHQYPANAFCFMSIGPTIPGICLIVFDLEKTHLKFVIKLHQKVFQQSFS